MIQLPDSSPCFEQLSYVFLGPIRARAIAAPLHVEQPGGDFLHCGAIAPPQPIAVALIP